MVLGDAQSLIDVAGVLTAKKTGYQTEWELNPASELHIFLCMAEVILGDGWKERVKPQI